ncbi:hypothetical protein M2281_002548 [Mesorhizobium soli]|uniref:hypothetical protein n=1 Tax=Pseudaminobacter soli (ex Li et al. 2025) TaxID=1295366 RepID=UPI0024744221|nr:hypothetical protein [Mesorhizobium soli]MDH6231950.1 hypothetical protein [Mesorhizobium soli]
MPVEADCDVHDLVVGSPAEREDGQDPCGRLVPVAEIADVDNVDDALHQGVEDIQLLDGKTDELFGMEREISADTRSLLAFVAERPDQRGLHDVADFEESERLGGKTLCFRSVKRQPSLGADALNRAPHDAHIFWGENLGSTDHTWQKHGDLFRLPT